MSIYLITFGYVRNKTYLPFTQLSENKYNPNVKTMWLGLVVRQLTNLTMFLQIKIYSNPNNSTKAKALL